MAGSCRSRLPLGTTVNLTSHGAKLLTQTCYDAHMMLSLYRSAEGIDFRLQARRSRSVSPQGAASRVPWARVQCGGFTRFARNSTAACCENEEARSVFHEARVLRNPE